MVPVTRYAELVRAVIEEYAAIPPSVGDIAVEVVFDEARGHYELVYAGWIGPKRVHGAVIHIDLRGDQVWIQHDGTSTGVANDLIARGIPEASLVYAWQSPALRRLARPEAAPSAPKD